MRNQPQSNGAHKRGGRRPGAGRKKGSRAKATIQAKATLADLAKQHTETALAVLVSVATTGESESARVAAANHILDRGYGRPPQAVQHSGALGTYDLTKVSDGDLDRLEQILGPLADAGGDSSGESAAGS